MPHNYRFIRLSTVLFGWLSASSALAETPIPTMADANLQSCLTQTATANGWQYVEQITQLRCPNRGIVGLSGLENLSALSEIDLSQNKIVDVSPLQTLHTLTRLNLSGNTGVSSWQVWIILMQNTGFTHVGLNGIALGGFLNSNILYDPITGRNYNLIELDIGNTQLQGMGGDNNNPLQFLSYYPTIERLNLSGNGLTVLQGFDPSIGAIYPNPVPLPGLRDLDLSNNRITDLFYLQRYRTITRLNLAGDTSLPCSSIDSLSFYLTAAIIQRPESCLPY